MIRIQSAKCIQNIGNLSLKRSASQTETTSNTFNITINGKSVNVQPGITIMQACQDAGFKIPHFCYHSRLAIAGNCRMCLVEVEKSVKPVASCAMSVAPGMKVHTESLLAKKAREGILEFILANHPLDCPICDQGGECDLQDLSMYCGNDRSRYTDVRYSGKRSVVDKDFGPLIKTSFTKCIHCTRCVRFANEVAGVPYLGTTGRGNNTQIGMYIERLFLSELSGNVIDLCPVGALTSKPYAYTARPWETRKIESIDVMDALGSNIILNTRAGSLLRILPRLNEDINEEWLSDKARFSYDGLSQQRLISPMIRPKNNILTECDWPSALTFLASELVNRKNVAAVVGDLTDCETIVAMRDLLGTFNSNLIYIEEQMYNQVSAKQRSTYIMNSGIAGVEQSDFILLVNTNPRYEAPLLNARIRKAWLQNSALKICYIGPMPIDLTYDIVYLGNDIEALQRTSEGQHEIFNDLVRSAKKPIVILGTYAQSGFDSIYEMSWNVSKRMSETIEDKSWNPFNLLHKNASTVGALDLDCLVNLDDLYKHGADLVFLLNCDSNRIQRSMFSENCLFVYIGHQGDQGASIADVILPGCAYTEKSSTFVNTEGRVQVTRKAVTPPGIARDDWKIIRALSEFTNRTLSYDDISGITRRLIQSNQVFSVLNNIQNKPFEDISFPKNENKTANGTPFILPMMQLSDYWMNNAISRSSNVMARCVRATDSITLQASSQK